MRKPVDSYSPYIINMYKVLVSHWPVLSGSDLDVKLFERLAFLFDAKAKNQEEWSGMVFEGSCQEGDT